MLQLQMPQSDKHYGVVVGERHSVVHVGLKTPPQARHFVASFDRPNIRYTLVEKDQPRQQLLDFLRHFGAQDAGIVYCASRNRVEQTARWLCEQGFRALPYHAGMEAELRSVIGLGFKVRLAEPKSIERSEGKAKRVIDKRQFK